MSEPDLLGVKRGLTRYHPTMRRPAISLLLFATGCAGQPAATPAQPAQPATAAPVAAVSADAAPASQEAAVAEGGGQGATGADPSINQPWASAEIDPLVGRLESESREIWVHRERLIDVVAPRPGAVVADIGSGSGFLTVLMGKRVGPSGKVYAVDINPTMLEEVSRRAKSQGVNNLETRVATQDSSPLEPNSVDLVFICDTYHHFEKPDSTMRSVFGALKPGGELVVVDFERVEGKTQAFMMEHVRAGKDVFRQEILDVGFELVTEHDMPELDENYVLRFRRP